MLRLFGIKNAQFNDDELFAEKLALLDGERRARVNALALREKKNSCLAAGLIVPLALKKCGYSGDVVTATGQWGKPFLVKPAGVFYNVSHSGDWTVIALSDGEVGCDIQQVKPVDLRLAGRFFTAEESRAIAAAGGKSQELFYRYWVVKDSYLKAVGVGLNRALNSFSARFTAGGVKVCDGEGDGGWLVSEIDCAEGYKLACCAREYAPDCGVEELKI